MKLQGDYLFEASVDEVWTALLDPVVLAAVMPGCEKLELVDGQYVGELNIKVGPVQGKFSGKVDLKDMVAPTSYTMNVDGRGAPGFVKATASVKLEAEGANTRMRYDADAQVGGKIASVGQRLLEASSRAITKQSLEGLNDNIKLRAAASKAAAEADAAEQAEAAAVPAAAEAPASAEVKKEEGEAATDAKEAAPSPEAKEEATKEAPPPPKKKAAPPPVVLKQVDQKALAAEIAKEVTKSLVPQPVLIAIAVGILAFVVWLIIR
jgi:carbon monoxide dehydrogenase subunit G